MKKNYILKPAGNIVNVVDEQDTLIASIESSGAASLHKAISQGLGVENVKEVTAYVAGWNTAVLVLGVKKK